MAMKGMRNLKVNHIKHVNETMFNKIRFKGASR